MMKNFEADQKRLRAIMLNFSEKKTDMHEDEKRERADLVLMIKDSFNLFKVAYNEQTLRHEKSGGVYINDISAITQAEMSQNDLSHRQGGASNRFEKNYKENET